MILLVMKSLLFCRVYFRTPVKKKLEVLLSVPKKASKSMWNSCGKKNMAPTIFLVTAMWMGIALRQGMTGTATCQMYACFFFFFFFFFPLKNIRFQALLLLIWHLHGSFDFPESHLNLRLFNGIQDWVLLINRDNERQRAMPPQRPYSDAYLSGLPPKRRQVWNYEFSILKFIAMIVLILRKVLKW